MATYTKAKLSGSTDGKQIKIGATGSTGTTVHTAVSGTTNWDEVWIYAVNSDTSPIILTVEWGDTTVPDSNIQVTIPPQSGYIEVVPGLLLQNSAVVRAYAGNTGATGGANKILVNGFVNQIVP